MLNEEAAILNELITEEYDEVLEQKVYYEMGILKNGTEIPESFLAIVKYRAGNEVVTKTVYLLVGVNEWEVTVDE